MQTKLATAIAIAFVAGAATAAAAQPAAQPAHGRLLMEQSQPPRSTIQVEPPPRAVTVAPATAAPAQARSVAQFEVEPPPTRATAAPAPVAPTIQVTRNAEVSAPPPVERAQSARLSPRDRAALDAVQRWERTGTAEALVGQGGDIRFAYGYSRPTITCSPLHICTIRLIAGETITSLAIGDTVRWIAEQSTAGDTPVVMIKPTQGGISTNLVITTDAGRVYFMHLVAHAREYMPMVGFFDPAFIQRQQQTEAREVQRLRARVEAAEEESRQAREAAERRTAEHRERTVVAELPAADFDPTKLDFSMTCRPNSRAAADFVPARVFSTRTHTFVQLPQALEGRELPAVFRRVGETMQLLNARRSGQFIVVDGTPDHIALALDVGHQARVVDCQRSR